MSDNLDDIPLPEPCTIEDKLVSTRKNLVEEQDGNLFNRKCDNLDTTIPKRKDRFIECEELPEVPKVLLKNKQFNEVEFPGVPLAEIPKKLLAHLLPCCLEGRSAGFDFEVEEELDSNGEKVEIDFETDLITKTFTIQFGSEGFSYLRLGLNIKPELCFCDENCGDRDYVHLSVNLGAEYSDEDTVQDPDLTIDDEQLTNLISNFGGGGGGGGNPLCSRKFFGVYVGLANSSSGGAFVPYDLQSYTASDIIQASLAPYLTGFELVPNGIYKLEYFCEHRGWYVTDGQCSNLAPLYSYPSYVLVEATGLPNETYTGTFILQHGGELYPYTDCTPFPFALDSSGSTDTEANTFVDGITFTKVGNTGLNVKYSFQIKEGADASMVYTTVLSNSTGSCSSKTMKFIFKVRDNTPEVEEEVEEEEE